MTMRLHTRYQNSAGERVRIALNLKGLDYEYVVAPPVRSPEYRTINPQGLLPTLEVDGVFVAQSMAIIEYLEEICPEPSLLPMAPLERARVRAFAQHIAADLHPINNRRVRSYLADTMGQSDDAVLDWYRHWVAVTLTALEAELARRTSETPFCFGDRPMLASVLSRKWPMRDGSFATLRPTRSSSRSIGAAETCPPSGRQRRRVSRTTAPRPDRRGEGRCGGDRRCCGRRAFP